MRLSSLKGFKTGPLSVPRLALAAVIGATVSYQTPALAQQGFTLEEIIVTATKKDEMLQDVASTVNVITGDRLNEFNTFSFQDLQNLTPGLSLSFNDPRTFSISLRGVPFDPDSAATETVVTYLNGISVRAEVAFNQLFDIERIEVLRGPQGTLQGETSPSGSIQVYTKTGNPDAFEGQVRQSLDDNNATITDFGVSVPLIDGKLGMRIAGAYTADDQFDLRSINNGKSATNQSKAGRINFHWLPTDNLTASLTMQYQERFTDGLEAVEGTDRLDGADPTLDSFDRISLQEGNSDTEVRNETVTLLVDYSIAGHTLSSVTGYQDNNAFANRDLDIGNIFANRSFDQLVNSDFEIFTQEFRITNDDADFWEYIAGVYYNDRNSFTVNNNITPSGYLYVPGQPPAVGIPGDPDFLVARTQSLIPSVSETMAVFLDNKFFFTDDTTLQVGARYQKRRSFKAISTALTADLRGAGPGGSTIPAGTVFPAGIALENQSNTTNVLTGSIKLAHDLNEEWTVYTSVGRGYRPDDVTITPSVTAIAAGSDLLVYDEEDSTSFEVGFKSILDNGRYQINGAVYYQMFDNFINRAGNLFVDSDLDGALDTPILGGLNYNADANVAGVELEGTALITENWVVFGAVSYNDAKFDGASVPCGNNLDQADPGSQIKTCQSDGRVGPEPLWSASTTTEYTIPEVFAGAEAYVRALYKFTDNRTDDFASVNSNLYNKYELGAYGVADLYIGLRSEDQTWDVSIWSKNLFDQEAKTDLGFEQVQGSVNLVPPTTPGSLSSGYSTVSVIPGQTIGITGTYRFGGL
jgi:iron complex outermembrane recepter protein